MPELIKVHEGEVIKRNYSFTDLKKDNYNVSFPRDYLKRSAADLAEYSVFEVRDVPRPAFQILHSQNKLPLELINGEWVQAWANEPFPFDFSQSRCLNIVKGKRRDAVLSGVLFKGNLFDTDTASQAAIMMAAAQAASDPTFSVDWKLSDGEFEALSAVDLSNLFRALNDKIQAAFTEEKQRIEIINNCTTFEELTGLPFISQTPEA